MTWSMQLRRFSPWAWHFNTDKSYGTMRHVRSGKNSNLGRRTPSASADGTPSASTAEAVATQQHRPLARPAAVAWPTVTGIQTNIPELQ